MGTKFTYALILTACQVVFTLVMYFLDYQGEKIETGQALGWLALPIHIVVLWFALSAVREKSPDKSMSYGQGVGAGTLISLYAGLMGAVYNFIHFKFINPNYFSYLADYQRPKLLAKGMSEAMVDQQVEMMQKFGPIFGPLFVIVISVVVGVLISLVLAAILKRPAAQGFAPPVQS